MQFVMKNCGAPFQLPETRMPRILFHLALSHFISFPLILFPSGRAHRPSWPQPASR